MHDPTDVYQLFNITISILRDMYTFADVQSDYTKEAVHKISDAYKPILETSQLGGIPEALFSFAGSCVLKVHDHMIVFGLASLRILRPLFGC